MEQDAVLCPLSKERELQKPIEGLSEWLTMKKAALLDGLIS
jgi:hypothetical protein